MLTAGVSVATTVVPLNVLSVRHMPCPFSSMPMRIPCGKMLEKRMKISKRDFGAKMTSTYDSYTHVEHIEATAAKDGIK